MTWIQAYRLEAIKKHGKLNLSEGSGRGDYNG